LVYGCDHDGKQKIERRGEVLTLQLDDDLIQAEQESGEDLGERRKIFRSKNLNVFCLYNP